MSKRSRRNHTPAFWAKVALAALKSDKTLSELATQFDVHPTQITQWKAQLLERAAAPPEPLAPTTSSFSLASTRRATGARLSLR